jgi:predicted XRE-type DNA-binding protein
MGKLQNSKSLEERFWEKVDKNGSIPEHQPELGQCWEWRGARSRDGYGRLRKPGQKKAEQRELYAHVIAWQIANDPIPQGMCVLHKCDNPPCCNPAHLFLGTRTDNNLDKKLKGRINDRHGANNSNVKITEDDVTEIRKLVALGMSQIDVGAQFGIKQPQVSRIIRGVSWGKR